MKESRVLSHTFLLSPHDADTDTFRAMVRSGHMPGTPPSGIVGAPSVEQAVAAYVGQPVAATSPAATAAVPGPSLAARLLALVHGCDYYGGPIQDCGCTKTFHCALGKGGFRDNPHEVTRADCFRCVTGHH